MSGLFKSKEGKLTTIDTPQSELGAKLSEWLGSQVGKTGPKYEGDRVAPMSGYEEQSLDFLKQYGQGGFSQPTQQAAGEISKTLTGQYDPSSSPYYQAMKAASARNLEETQKNIGSAAAGGGRYWGGARLGAQGEAATERNLGMDALLGQLASQERQNRLNILPQAMQLGQYMEQDPLRKATAMQSLGALPRNIAQAANDAAYQQWMQEQYEYPMQIGQLAAGVQKEPTYLQSPGSPSPFSQIAPLLGTVALGAMTGGLGLGAGAAGAGGSTALSSLGPYGSMMTSMNPYSAKRFKKNIELWA